MGCNLSRYSTTYEEQHEQDVKESAESSDISSHDAASPNVTAATNAEDLSSDDNLAAAIKKEDITKWLLLTHSGTPIQAFEDWIKTLPDGGQGRRIVYEHVDFQAYVATMTHAELQEVVQNPIVAVAQSNGPMENLATGA